MTRRALHAGYATGLAPRDVVDAAYARLAAAGDPGIFLHCLPQESVRAAADALPAFDPERFPLWGLPFAIKDNIDLAGAPTTASCPAFTYWPERSATVVERLQAAGALLIGKTNLDQFATGLVGVRTPFPAPRNPFDAERVPGGSSSGSAVAVAQGIVAFSLGTDTAGSGRIPAAFNNLVGLKPSLGALSTRGVVPACRTLDCVSIFALDVDDARAVFTVAAAYDEEDPYSRRVSQQDEPIRRIALPRDEDLLFFGDAAMETAWRGAQGRLDGLAIDVSRIDLGPFFAVARMLYDGPWVAERRAAAGRLMETPEALHPVTRSILAGADRLSAVDCFQAFYRLAELRRACERALDCLDAIIVPTAPIFPRLADLEADPIGPNSRLGTYTNFVNLLDLAAIAVPGPARPDGLPAGLTLIGRAESDLVLADLAAAIFPGVGGPHAPLQVAA
jgi:allophanate hydrolase